MSQTPDRRKLFIVLGAALVVVVLAGGAFLLGKSSASVAKSSASSARTAASSASRPASSTRANTTVAVADDAVTVGAPSSGLPTIKMSALPPEARTTLKLIAAGGPYPYSRDGVVYSNIEKILPKQTSGYYHEYTVVTPGSKDRGARRIITGKQGERFYTADHYKSFKEVVS